MGEEFYNSKYYTCEEMDRRLFQGTYDDAVKAGFTGTKEDFDAFFKTVPDNLDKLNSNIGIAEYPKFSEEESYKIGDVVNYKGLLYEFTTNHPAGEWLGSDVKPTSIKKKSDEKFTELVGFYVENDEYIKAYVDYEGKFLWGIKYDGSIEWAKGLPSPVKKALVDLEKKINNNISSIDSIKKSIVSIESDISSINESISEFQKELDTVKELKQTFSYIENEEYLHAVTDLEGHILFGIKRDGRPYYPYNDIYHVIENDEFFAAWMDNNNRILFGIKRDGRVYAPKLDISAQLNNKQDKLKSGETIKTINGESLLGAGDIKIDFTEQVSQIMELLNSKQEKLKSGENIKTINGIPILGAGNIQIDGATGEGVDAANMFLSIIDDPESRTEVVTDLEGRIIGYRDSSGVRHEKVGFDTKQYFLNGSPKNFLDFSEFSTELEKHVNTGLVNLNTVNGVIDHNTPNLLIPSELEKTFNDGTNSFTPPNVGYEMSNPIECQAGDWFTRTGVATGIVVVTDSDDKNGTRLFNPDGTTLPNTFQIPTDLTWVKYIRMAVEVGGANDGTVVICKGKNAFTGNDKGDFLTVPKLQVQSYNIPKDLKYLKTADGRYWELYVDDSDFQLKIREVDLDIITSLPADFKPWTLKGSFDGQFDRMLIQNNNYFIEIKATGVVRYKYIGNVVSSNYANFEHFYSPSGEERYGFVFGATDSVIGKGFTLFDKDFNILDTNIGITGYNTTISDMHDFIYLADDHILLYTGSVKSIRVPGMTRDISINGPRVTELKKQNGTWKVIGEFKAVDYPQLCTDAFGDLGSMHDVVDSHSNTISIDYDGNLLINCRNWETWLKIRRVENLDGTVTLGSDTLDYDEAVIGRVGGRHNSGYIDSKRVLNDGFAFTDVPSALNVVSEDAWEEWQWFHCHDVKYWSMKEIGGVQYPTYTLFDNNYWTDSAFKFSQYNVLNQNNNINNNPQGSGNYYLTNLDSDEQYAERTHSRVIQVTIDWETHTIKDYRVYYIPKIYSREQSGATMLEEGIIAIAYSYSGIFGLWDFTTEETNIQGKIYKGAKELFKGQYDSYKICYRANVYKLKQ